MTVFDVGTGRAHFDLMSILWRVLFVLDGMAAVLIGSELSLSEIPPIYGCHAMAIAVPLFGGHAPCLLHTFSLWPDKASEILSVSLTVR